MFVRPIGGYCDCSKGLFHNMMDPTNIQRSCCPWCHSLEADTQYCHKLIAAIVDLYQSNEDSLCTRVDCPPSETSSFPNRYAQHLRMEITKVKNRKSIVKTLGNHWIVSKLCDFSDDKLIASITLGNGGYIYYTTINSEDVWKIHKDSILEQPQLVLNSRGSRLHGLAWDSNQNILYICDSGNTHKILQYNINTGVLWTLPETEPKRKKIWELESDDDNILYYPEYITLDNSNGELYVTDWHRLQKVQLKTGEIKTVAGRASMSYDGNYKNGKALEAYFDHPAAIALGRDGTIYVADTGNHCIRKIKDGIVSTVVESNWSLKEPIGIQLDNDGNLLVCDRSFPLKKIDIKKNEIISFAVPGIQSNRVHSFCREKDGTMYFGSAGALFRVEDSWKWTRYLWIGHMKENSVNCHLKILPKEMIQEISAWVRVGLNERSQTAKRKAEDDQQRPSTQKPRTE